MSEHQERRLERWSHGIERELTWWRGYLNHRGYDAPDDFNLRFDPESPLQDHVARLLPADVPSAEITILDCAAGPATTLGKTLDGIPLRIVAVDALADQYAEMLQDARLVAPVQTQRCEVERLDSIFADNMFDLVYMRFALDHCYDPRLALHQMVRVARPGGTVLIEHYREPGPVVYQGLRQWDLRPERGDLLVASADDQFRISDVVTTRSRSVEYTDTWLTVTLGI